MLSALKLAGKAKINNKNMVIKISSDTCGTVHVPCDQFPNMSHQKWHMASFIPGRTIGADKPQSARKKHLILSVLRMWQ